jgi:hypothetical protein
VQILRENRDKCAAERATRNQKEEQVWHHESQGVRIGDRISPELVRHDCIAQYSQEAASKE